MPHLESQCVWIQDISTGAGSAKQLLVLQFEVSGSMSQVINRGLIPISCKIFKEPVACYLYAILSLPPLTRSIDQVFGILFLQTTDVQGMWQATKYVTELGGRKGFLCMKSVPGIQVSKAETFLFSASAFWIAQRKRKLIQEW